MSKYWLRAVTTLGIIAVAMAFAAPVRGEEAAAKPEKPKRHQFTGVIESVDAAAGTVIVKKDQESKTFKVGEKTKYSTADKKDAALADLKTGEKLTVVYTEEGGTLMAHKIAPPQSHKKKAKTEGDER
jgi:Cu/Ag efflux protein CusF